jgi:hypothetical protein
MASTEEVVVLTYRIRPDGTLVGADGRTVPPMLDHVPDHLRQGAALGVFLHTAAQGNWPQPAVSVPPGPGAPAERDVVVGFVLPSRPGAGAGG